MKTVEEGAGGWFMLKFSTRCGQSTYCELGDTDPALGGMAPFLCAHGTLTLESSTWWRRGLIKKTGPGTG